MATNQQQKVRDWREYFGGRFVSGPDFTTPKTLTIHHTGDETIEDPDNKKPPQHRLVVYWAEKAKPWVISKTDAQCVGAMFGDDMNGWAGKRVTLQFDTEVMFGRDKVGGVRVKGSPDISEPITVTVKLRKRRPVDIVLVNTGQRQAQQEAPTADLATVLSDAELTLDDLNKWRDSVKKGPVTDDMPKELKDKIGGWLAADSARLDAIRAVGGE